VASLWKDSVVAAVGACEPTYQESLAVGSEEVRIFRCSWGWCVKRGGEPYRSRVLLDAFDQAFGPRTSATLIGNVLASIERTLDAQHTQRGETVSTVLPAGTIG
jgi:hypothetical protein